MTLRILIVEDSKMDREIVIGHILQTGIPCECIHVEDGEELFRSLAEDAQFDAIFLDLSLPGMDGYEVLDKWGQGEFVYTIPIFIMSGLVDSTRIKKLASKCSAGIIDKNSRSQESVYNALRSIQKIGEKSNVE